MRYLYGADVKKIQGYISGSSRLTEIAGASELVEYVCTDLFDEFTGNSGAVEKIIAAAGKIRAVIADRETAEKIMSGFPKCVVEAADGIQFVQAIVEIAHEVTAADSHQLESRLQQEMPMPSPLRDWSVVAKYPRSGKPVAELCGGESLDRAAFQKRRAVDQHWKKLRRKFGVPGFPSDFKKIAGTDSFIAVIHADGNSLGQKLMKLEGGAQYESRWKAFSQELDDATTMAALTAYRGLGEKKFRPIILGGDDLTVICSADEAIGFTKRYLEAFRDETAKKPSLQELTACAGIAFIKENYPFHFGLELAELLCSEAKKRAKARTVSPVPSCLMYGLELGSFIESGFDDIKRRRLTAGKVTLDFGPYATSGSGGLPQLEDMLEAARTLAGRNPLRTGLRRYLSELHVDRVSADFLARRIQQVAEEKDPGRLQRLLAALEKITGRGGGLENSLVNGQGRSPVLDLLVLAKFMTQEGGVEKNDESAI